MTTSLVELLLLVLLVAVTINLVLTIRITAIVRDAPEPEDLPFTAKLDAAVPAFSGARLSNGATVSSVSLAGGTALVLVFLSSGCADCRRRIPELTAILPAIRAAGIELLIVGMESPARVRKLLVDTGLLEHAIVLDRNSRKALNPRNGSPFYLFVDGNRDVKASNFLGDENWLVFMEQMKEWDPDGITSAAERA